MTNNGWVQISKKVDLGREVQGILPISSMDPSVQADVRDGYNLGTNADGLGILEGKDASYELAFYRLAAGVGATVVLKGNALVISSTVLSGTTSGVMLTTTYDTNNDGIVDHAALADSTPWTGVSGKPTSFPPSPHTHPESDVVGLSTDLANRVPITRMVTTAFSLQGGGPLSADLSLSLIGDKANVGPDMRYGTDPSGNLGWYPASVGAGDMTQAVYDKNANGIVDKAEALTNGVLTTAMIAPGAVTGSCIASGTIPGGALAPNAVVTNLGYKPLNKAGDVASGQVAVTMVGPMANSNMYQGAHLLAETSGVGAGSPTIAFANLTGGTSAGSVALYYQGPHNDIQLQYGDNTKAHLLSSISVISGAQIIAGTIPAAALAAGVAQANLGFLPINGQAGGQYNLTGPIALQKDYGLGSQSWANAAFRVQTQTGGGNRPQIGFYYPGSACSLYFEPVDLSMRYIDSGGTIRILLDSVHGVTAANLTSGAAVGNIGYTPVNRAGDTMTGNLTIQSGGQLAGVIFRNSAVGTCEIFQNTDGFAWVNINNNYWRIALKGIDV